MSSDDDEDEAGVDVPEAPSPNVTEPEDLGPEVPAAAGTAEDDESLGPDVPTPPTPDEADTEVVGLFWKLVVVFNVAVFGVTVGPMIGFFLGNWDLGLQVFAVGALALAYGLVRYYRFREDRDGS